MQKNTVKLLKKINQSKLTNLVSVIDYSEYRDNPSDFFRDILGVTLTSDQQKILAQVKNNRLTCVPSAHAMGKTFVAAGLVLWWVYACQGLAITTAPTERQVNNLLWSELRKAWDRVGFPGQRGQTFVRFTESARAFGFTASQQYGADAFQGIHSNAGVLVICDEANGILPDILTGAEACTTGADDRLLLIGNPTSRGTPFEKKCKSGTPIRIPVWNHPNIDWAYNQEHKLKPEVAEQILDAMGGVKSVAEWPKEYQEKIQIPGAISIAWIEEVARPKGELSGYWQSRVEARFPEDALRALVPRSWFEAAKLRAWDGVDRGWRFGLDVADGQDCHALIGMNGNHITHGELIQSFGDRRDVSRAAKMGIDSLKAHPKSSIGVDNIGVGAGALSQVLDYCLDNTNHFAVGLNFGSAAGDTSRFGNLKAELFWKVRELFQSGDITINLPDEIAEKLEDDLSGIQWEESIKGKIIIEPKEQFRKQYGRSPDLADALAYAVGCIPLTVTELKLGGERSTGYLAEY